MLLPKAENETILGVPVDAVDLETTVEVVARWIEDRQKGCISLATAHGIQDVRRSEPARRAFQEADLVVADGMAMVWLLKLLGHDGVGRVYGPDLLLRLCDRSLKEGWRHYFLGGQPDTARLMIERLSERFPGLEVAGTSSPIVAENPRLDEDVVSAINESEAHIVWVGLGSPKQDVWMNLYRDAIRPQVLIGVGAAFDFAAGTKPQAPRWIQRSGLEWLFRWGSEPLRLSARYSRYPAFVVMAAWEVARKRLGGSVN